VPRPPGGPLNTSRSPSSARIRMAGPSIPRLQGGWSPPPARPIADQTAVDLTATPLRGRGISPWSGPEAPFPRGRTGSPEGWEEFSGLRKPGRIASGCSVDRDKPLDEDSRPVALAGRVQRPGTVRYRRAPEAPTLRTVRLPFPMHCDRLRPRAGIARAGRRVTADRSAVPAGGVASPSPMHPRTPSADHAPDGGRPPVVGTPAVHGSHGVDSSPRSERLVSSRLAPGGDDRPRRPHASGDST
jgi:hypothetical protein